MATRVNITTVERLEDGMYSVTMDERAIQLIEIACASFARTAHTETVREDAASVQEQLSEAVMAMNRDTETQLRNMMEWQERPRTPRNPNPENVFDNLRLPDGLGI